MFLSPRIRRRAFQLIHVLLNDLTNLTSLRRPSNNPSFSSKTVTRTQRVPVSPRTFSFKHASMLAASLHPQAIQVFKTFPLPLAQPGLRIFSKEFFTLSLYESA